MRKRYKTKKRVCGLCKPWKRGWLKRVNVRELLILKEFERNKFYDA